MKTIDLQNLESQNDKPLDLEIIRLGNEVSFSQMLQAIRFKGKWFLMKKFCNTFQVIFPEFNLHHRLLGIVLAEFDDIENLIMP
jgi:hypothetical protein